MAGSLVGLRDVEGVPEEGFLRNFGGGFREGARLSDVALVRAIEKLQRRRQGNEKVEG